MLSLLLSSVVFVIVQVSLAGMNVRRVLAQRMGLWSARTLVGILAAAPLVLLARRYSAAFASGNFYLWYLGDLPQRVAAPVMLVALFLVASGLLADNPLPPAARANPATSGAVGVLRITRHPVLWGIVIWSSFHVFANGDAASLVFFGSFLVSGLAAMWLIERQQAATLGADFRLYAEQTSNLPFVAIARGRNRLVWRELGVKPLLVVLAAFSLIVSVHPWLFGAYPLPGMDD